MAQQKRKPGLYAIFQTNQGTMVCELFEKQTPITVKNFIDLAEGNKEYTDPRTREKKKGRFYDGTTFHRVIPKFMIQGGDPTGTGTGNPGYRFQDEFNSSLKFDKPGRLAMANSGPATNGSQFFITEVPTPYLDNQHTIFGQVIEGMDVVRKITGVPRDSSDKPRQPVVLEKLTIERVPEPGP
ncbi:MAG: peptidylprolyl isomerase [Acidobacteria bacterium]|nr:peptidylprolyl isomerase [Acidobacteriota bacterium]